MDVLYRVREGRSRTFSDFFWVPRVPRPAGSAKPKVGNRNHKGFVATLAALMATEGVGFGAHICISGFSGCTERIKHHKFWVLV